MALKVSSPMSVITFKLVSVETFDQHSYYSILSLQNCHFKQPWLYMKMFLVFGTAQPANYDWAPSHNATETNRPVFLVLMSVGDIGLLLLGEAGLLLIGEILGGFLRPTTPACLRLSTSTSAACCTSATRWVLFCCSSCTTPPEGDIRQPICVNQTQCRVIGFTLEAMLCLWLKVSHKARTSDMFTWVAVRRARRAFSLRINFLSLSWCCSRQISSSALSSCS